MYNFKNDYQLMNELKRLYRRTLNRDDFRVEFLYSILDILLLDSNDVSKSKKLRMLDKLFKTESNFLNLTYGEKRLLESYKSKCIDFLNSLDKRKV